MDILLVTNKCPPDYDGGYELRAFQIANALRERGHSVDVATSRFRQGFTFEGTEPEWVHRIFLYVPISSKSGAARKLDAAWRRIESTRVASENVPAMRDFLKGRSYDLAYCFGMHRIGLATAVPLSEAGLPILWHAGGTFLADQLFRWPKEVPGFEASLRLFAPMWRQMEMEVDVSNVAFVSEFLRDKCAEAGLKPKNSLVISRGADFRVAKDVDRERKTPPMLFMASRLDPEKGIHTAIEALGLLLKRRSDLAWTLEIAGAPGDKAYRAGLGQKAIANGTHPRITFLGKQPRDTVLAKMREATAFLSCSRYGEPFAGTIIETLASGTPLLGSRDGSILEVVRHGESALLFDKDDADALSKHIETVLTDCVAARRLALAGCHVIEERYTLDRILDQTEEALRSVAASRSIKADVA